MSEPKIQVIQMDDQLIICKCDDHNLDVLIDPCSMGFSVDENTRTKKMGLNPISTIAGNTKIIINLDRVIWRAKCKDDRLTTAYKEQLKKMNKLGILTEESDLIIEEKVIILGSR